MVHFESNFRKFGKEALQLFYRANMSNNEDVLDSWEEIDESMINDQIHQIRRGITVPAESTQQNGFPRMMPTDEYYANSYTQPAKPTVTILRRPTQNSNEVKSCETKPRPPIKTLQQREQEYAQARLRILGSAKNPEDEIENNATPIVTNATRPLYEVKSVDSTVGDTLSMSQGSNQMRSTDGILRFPRGPDGSPGFISRR